MSGFVVNGKRHTIGRNVVLGMEEEAIPETSAERLELIQNQRRLLNDEREINVNMHKKLEVKDMTIVRLEKQLEEDEYEAQEQFKLWKELEESLTRERDTQITRGFTANKRLRDEIKRKEATITHLLAENKELRGQLN
jgi:hypothetical protein